MIIKNKKLNKTRKIKNILKNKNKNKQNKKQKNYL